MRDFAGVKDVLAYAERPSMHAKIAEGVVFKLTEERRDGGNARSFKAISNAFLC